MLALPHAMHAAATSVTLAPSLLPPTSLSPFLLLL